MAIVNGDILRIAYRWTDPWSNDLVNVYHYRVVDRGSDSEEDFLEQSAKAGLGAAAIADYLAYVPADYDLVDAKIDKVVWSAGKEEIVDSYAIVDLVGYAGGAASGDPMPPGVASLIKFRTTGVRTVGKTYLPPVGETAYSAGGISVPALVTLVDLITVFLDDINIGGGVTGTIRRVVHSKRSNAWLTFISGAVDVYFAYQRRRRTGVGS